jgi:hypothetical protein
MQGLCRQNAVGGMETDGTRRQRRSLTVSQNSNAVILFTGHVVVRSFSYVHVFELVVINVPSMPFTQLRSKVYVSVGNFFTSAYEWTSDLANIIRFSC